MPSLRFPAKITKWQIFKLSIPIFFSNLAIPLVGLVDTGLMGHLENEKFLIATSISTMVITMILWSFGFLRMGTVGMVSQYLGKGDYREIVYTILRNLILATIISLAIILLKPLILFSINEIFITSDQTKLLIDNYISIRVFSAPAELVTYILIGFFLGLQRTLISSLIIICLSILNILFSIYFVKELDLDITGVALGTLVSSYLTVIVSLIFTYFFIIKKFKIIPKFQEKILRPKKLIKLFNINFDIFIRTIFLTFAFFWITYISSTLGEEFIAINSILLQLIIISSFFLDSYAFSTEGIVGYSVGKKSIKMFLTVVKNSLQLSFFTGFTISIFYFFVAKDIINLLTDLDFLRYLSYKYIVWVIIIPPIASFCYQLDGIFLGATQTKELRNSMIISVILYVILSIFLTQNLDNYGVWFSLTLFMILRSSILHFYFSKIINKFR